MYKVLIVDDEALVRVGLISTIDWESYGYTIIADEGNGESAFEAYKKYRPDVVFADIQMPKRDGLWLVEQIRKDSMDVKVVLLTCHDDFSYARRALKAGADDYLLKSELEDEELIALLQKMTKDLDERSRQSSQYDIGTSRGMLEKTLLNELVKHRFELTDVLSNSLTSIDFQVSDSNYSFFYVSYLSCIGQVNEAVLNLFREIFKDNKIHYIYRNSADGCLFMMELSTLTEEQIKRLTIKANKQAAGFFDIQLQCLYSRIGEDISHMLMTYTSIQDSIQIMYLLEPLKFYMNESENIEFREVDVVSYLGDAGKKAVELVKSHDLERLEHLVDNIIDSMVVDVIHPLSVKYFFSTILNDVYAYYELLLEGSECLRNQEKYTHTIMNQRSIYEAGSSLKDFLGEVHGEVRHSNVGQSTRLAEEVRHYIDHHFTEKISLEEVAKQFNVSKQYLSSLFKKEIGDNMTSYIHNKRIDKAKQLLISSNLSIKEITDEVGYANQQYFSKTFKSYTGMTIMAYKKQNIRR